MTSEQLKELATKAFAVEFDGDPDDVHYHKGTVIDFAASFAASIRAETMEWDFELLRILRECGVVAELRKLGRFDNADKLENILAIRDAGKKE